MIGTGGATIKSLIEETGVANIAIDKSAEPGEIVITASTTTRSPTRRRG